MYKIKELSEKLLIILCHQIFFLFCVCMYKMFKVTFETFATNCVHTIKVNKADNKSVLCIKMIDIQKKLDVKNIHDLVDKEIQVKFKGNNLTDEQIKK